MENDSGPNWSFLPLLFCISIPFFVFAPLIMSALENPLLDSDHVYRLFVRIGLADELDVIYSPIVRAIGSLF